MLTRKHPFAPNGSTECDAGYATSSTAGLCDKCPVGTYAGRPGKHACKACGAKKTTAGGGTCVKAGPTPGTCIGRECGAAAGSGGRCEGAHEWI
jgi:hypothetical protein